MSTESVLIVVRGIQDKLSRRRFLRFGFYSAAMLLVAVAVGFLVAIQNKTFGIFVAIGLLVLLVGHLYLEGAFRGASFDDACRFIDESLGTNDQAQSISYLLTEEPARADRGALLAYISQQLDEPLQSGSTDERLRFEPRRSEIARILSALLLLVIAVVLWFRFTTLPGKRLEAAAGVEKFIEEHELPENVKESFEELQLKIADATASKEEISDALDAARESLNEAQEQLAESSTEIGDGEEAALEEGGDRVAIEKEPTATPTATPTPTPTPTPTATPKGSKKQPPKPTPTPPPADKKEEEKKKKEKEEEKKKEQQDEKKEGEKDDQGAKQQGDKSGNKGDAESASQDQGKQDSPDKKKGDSQGQGSGGSSEGDEKGEGKNKGKAEGKGGKGEGGQSGRGSDSDDKQEKGEKSDSQSGDGKSEQDSLGKASDQLNKVEQQLGLEGDKKGDEKKQGGSDPDQQKQDQKGSQKGGDKGEEGAGSGDKKGKEKGQKGGADRNQQKGDDKQPDKAGDSPKGGSEGKEDKGEKQDAKAGGKAGDKPADKSGNNPSDKGASMPQGGGAPKQPDLGEDDQGKALDGKKGFNEVEINRQNETLDPRYTENRGKVQKNNREAAPRVELKQLELAKPESIQDRQSQNVPLEYRDLLQ